MLINMASKLETVYFGVKLLEFAAIQMWFTIEEIRLEKFWGCKEFWYLGMFTVTIDEILKPPDILIVCFKNFWTAQLQQTICEREVV